MKQTLLYFAYGSNLNSNDLLQSNYGFREGDLHPVKSAYLPDRDLRFTRYSETRKGGTLDIVEQKGSAVPGMLFEVKNGDVIAKLDRKEGNGVAYKKIDGSAILPDGTLVQCFTYEVIPEQRKPFVEPTKDYIDIVRSGLREHNLSGAHLDRAISNNTPTSQIDSLFVYGTLMRGEKRHSLLAKGQLACILLSETFGTLIDVGDYPALLLKETSELKMVQGEFCRFSNVSDAFNDLDAVEGFKGYVSLNNLFIRTIIHVGMLDGRIRTAWVYVWWSSNVTEPIIKSNDWREHNKTKDSILRKILAKHILDSDEADILTRIQNDWSSPKHNDLVSAFTNSLISERRLAQVTGKWCVEID